MPNLPPRPRGHCANTAGETLALFEIEIVSPCGKAIDHFGVEMVESRSNCCSLFVISTLEPWWKGVVSAGGWGFFPSQPLGLFWSSSHWYYSVDPVGLPPIIMLLSDGWVHRPRQRCSLNLIQTPAIVFSPFLLSAPYKTQWPLKWIYSTTIFRASRSILPLHIVCSSPRWAPPAELQGSPGRTFLSLYLCIPKFRNRYCNELSSLGFSSGYLGQTEPCIHTPSTASVQNDGQKKGSDSCMLWPDYMDQPDKNPCHQDSSPKFLKWWPELGVGSGALLQNLLSKHFA